MARQFIARSCLLVAFAVSARGAGGESVLDEKFAPPTPQVRQMWMQELAAIKRDMDRASCLLEESRDIVVNIHSLIHPTDKTPVDVVIRRTEALLRDLQTMAGAPDLAWADTALAKLREQAKTALSEADQTRIYLDTCAVRRRLSLSNPLLEFDEIIFSRGVGWRGLLHVTPWGTGGSNENRLIRNSWEESDWPESYGRVPEGESQPDDTARPGLFVLSGYKTSEPRIEPLFMDAVLENGRHRGKKVVNFPGEYARSRAPGRVEDQKAVFNDALLGDTNIFLPGSFDTAPSPAPRWSRASGIPPMNDEVRAGSSVRARTRTGRLWRMFSLLSLPHRLFRGRLNSPRVCGPGAGGGRRGRFPTARAKATARRRVPPKRAPAVVRSGKTARAA